MTDSYGLAYYCKYFGNTFIQSKFNTKFKLLKLEIPQTEQIIKENKGFGKSLALSLFPIMQYNKDRSAKQIISYIRLSPKIFESGSSIKKKQTINKMGNSKVRRILYLSAMSCIRYNEVFKKRYEKLLAKGKSKKVAIVAIMCAIIRYLKAYYFTDEMIKNDRNIAY